MNVIGLIKKLISLQNTRLLIWVRSLRLTGYHDISLVLHFLTFLNNYYQTFFSLFKSPTSPPFSISANGLAYYFTITFYDLLPSINSSVLSYYNGLNKQPWQSFHLCSSTNPSGLLSHDSAIFFPPLYHPALHFTGSLTTHKYVLAFPS